jgi:CHAT domain-containing protein
MTIRSNGHCLEDDEIYNYLTGSSGEKYRSNIESHLSICPDCRRELAQLLRVLNPEPSESSEIAQEPPPQEIRDMLALVQKVSRGESKKKRIYQWGAIAAAAVIAIGLSSAGFTYLYVRAKSQALCDQARALLQQVYEPRSPNDLRLDLPFSSEATIRNGANSDEASSGAERYFNQAIGVRERMTEARLGLGYLHLKKNQFSRAEKEFQAVLDLHDTQVQALIGRGVSRFEEGLASDDPMDRSSLLGSALADFESVLRLDPKSSEALYDKVQVLYQVGRHKEALQDIEAYLARDHDSIWAVKLRDLKIRIQTNRSEFLEKEVERAAQARDARALETLVRIVPSKIASMVDVLLGKALAMEGLPASKEILGPDALQWAANSLAYFHRNATSDVSCARLLDFYGGLSPPQKQAKRTLDAQLEQLISLFGKNDFKSPLQGSKSLIDGFEKLRDYWQLVRVYQLRGSCFFYGKTDFSAAREEFAKMLECAERTSNPDLVARSIGAVASSYSELHKYDNTLSYLSRLKGLAESHHMENWSAYASSSLGLTYLTLNQLQESMFECERSLKIAYRIMDPSSLVLSLGNLATVMERMGRYDEASILYSESDQWQAAFIKEGILEPSPEADLLHINWLSKQAYFALWKKDLRRAEAHFNEAIKGASNNMHELSARNRLGLAQVYLQEGRYSEAETQVQAALNSSSKNQYPEIAWQSNSLMGVLLKQQGNDGEALKYFQTATEIIDGMRANVTSADLRQSFFDQRFDPYREIVSLLYHSKSTPEQALRYVDRAKARNLREFLALQRDPFLPLPPGIVTLEYFLSADEAFMFVSGPGGTNSVSNPVPLDELQGLVRQYLDCLQSGQVSLFTALSHKLYQLLIDPVLSKLENQPIDALVVIPDGPLHLLPFGALVDSSGHYLIENFAVSYAPSRGALQNCLYQKNAKKITNLPGAGRELAFLANLYSEHSRLLTAADLPSLGSIIGDYEIVHFSGHATLYQNRPRLVFHAPQGEVYLDSSIIQKLKLRKNRLTTLAGCNTAMGPLFDGETPWGLIPAFLNAGAPALLLSLIPVDDAAAGSLTSTFYDMLAHNMYSKAQALRLAQLSLLKQFRNNPDRNLLSWAPFVLVGDPR